MHRTDTQIEMNRGWSLLALIWMTIFSLSAGAQSVAMKKTLTGVEDANIKKWTLPLSYEAGSSMGAEWSSERRADSTISISPLYRLTSRLRVSGNVSLTKEHSGVGDAAFNNSAIGLSYLTKLTDGITWTVSGSGVLPTNPEEREQKSYQGAVRFGNALSFSEIPGGGFMSYRLTLGRNFHGYSQGADGSYNLKQSLSHSLDYTQPVYGNVSITGVFSYSQAWTYLDDERYSFLMAAQVSYQATEQASVSVGTANQAGALRPNGRDSNIEFFNDETSIVTLGLTYVL